MPKVSQMFPSKFLQAGDIEGQSFALTVSRLIQEDVNDGEKKWIIYFNEAQKGLVLNRTNANALEFLYGGDSDAWIGKSIILFTEMTSYMGKPCLGIRMRGPDVSAQPAVQAPLAQPTTEPSPAPAGNGPDIGPGEQAAIQARRAAQPMPTDPADLDDKIPF